MKQWVMRSAPHALMLALLSTAAGAQGSTIPTRQMPAASATSSEALGSVAAIRHLSNGNVLVNDPSRRRVVLLDKDLKLVAVVADTTSKTGNAYGVRQGGLIPYTGDSTFFVNTAALSTLLIDQNGNIVATKAAPRPNDVMALAIPTFGQPGFDSQGRIVYRSMDFGFRGGLPRPGPPQPLTPPIPPDSAAIVRFDLAARKLDTVAFYKIPKLNMQVSHDANGEMRIATMINPLPVVDEWAVLSDGTVAIVRGRDYHVEFIAAGGDKTTAEKIPYEWQRMTDDDKTRFLDSTKTAIESARKDMVAVNGASSSASGRAGVEGTATTALSGAPAVIAMTREGAGPPRVDAGRGSGAAGDPPLVQMVPISELPDYKPAFAPSSVKADRDGRLWVRTISTKPTSGGAVYEVIDRSGKLADRVQVPAGTTIAGFGAGGIVYLGMRDSTGLKLQRVALK